MEIAEWSSKLDQLVVAAKITEIRRMVAVMLNRVDELEMKLRDAQRQEVSK